MAAHTPTPLEHDVVDRLQIVDDILAHCQSELDAILGTTYSEQPELTGSDVADLRDRLVELADIEATLEDLGKLAVKLRRMTVSIVRDAEKPSGVTRRERIHVEHLERYLARFRRGGGES